MLKVKLLNEAAKAPTIATKGEDVAYDLYSTEDLVIPPNEMRKIPTGVAIEFTNPKRGAIFKDRSSMASMFSLTVGGVIDAGYRGELKVLMHNRSTVGYISIKKGEKVAQMIPVPIATDRVKVVSELSNSLRGNKGFGSSGK